ncbi:MAG: hypothetical protein HYV33_02515 [Candidatus Kerfeldbacteria bacterium]|nr:hypothetical protein [Candidatus Kerfeldbacteria bacterium]
MIGEPGFGRKVKSFDQMHVSDRIEKAKTVIGQAEQKLRDSIDALVKQANILASLKQSMEISEKQDSDSRAEAGELRKTAAMLRIAGISELVCQKIDELSVLFGSKKEIDDAHQREKIRPVPPPSKYDIEESHS